MSELGKVELVMVCCKVFGLFSFVFVFSVFVNFFMFIGFLFML